MAWQHGSPARWTALALSIGLSSIAVATVIVRAPWVAVACGSAAVVTSVARAHRVTGPGGLLAAVIGFDLVSGAFQARGVLPSSAAILVRVGIGLAFLLTLRQVVGAKPGRQRLGPIHVGALVLLLLACLEVLNPVAPSLSYALVGFQALAIPLLLLFVAAFARLTRRDLELLAGMVAVGWTISVALAMRQAFKGFTGGELDLLQQNLSTFRVGSENRLLGAATSNQDFGAFAALLVPAILAVAIGARQHPGFRRVAAALLGPSVFVLWSSLLRSALVGGIVGALIVLVLGAFSSQGRRTVRRALLISGILVTGGLLTVSTVSISNERVQASFARAGTIVNSGADQAFQDRTTTVWPQIVAIVSANPLGAGPGSVGAVSLKRPSEAPFGPLVTDNGYLFMTVQLGIGGGALFVVWILVTLVVLGEGAVDGRLAAHMATGALAAIAIAMLAGGYWGLVGPTSLLCVLIGLGARSDLPLPRRGGASDAASIPGRTSWTPRG
jgi:hypothetical protein